MKNDSTPQSSSGTISPGVGSSDLLWHIWLVKGTSGEYHDRREWVVCAYRTEAEAKRHAKLAQDRSESLLKQYDKYWDIPAKANEWDPQESHDYTGTRYTHSMTELRYLPNVKDDPDGSKKAAQTLWPMNSNQLPIREKQPSWLHCFVRLLWIRDLRNVEENIAALEVKASEWNRVVCDKEYILDRMSDYKAKLARKRKRAEWLRRELATDTAQITLWTRNQITPPQTKVPLWTLTLAHC